MTVIELKTVGKRYERGGRPFWALRHASLSVDAGEFVTLLGRSGSGKSTLLNIVVGLLKPTEGEVLLDGENLLDPKTDLLTLRRRVGMIFQKPTPFPMSVFDNVAYPLRLHFKLSRKEIEERVEAALQGASLWDEVKDQLRKSGQALSGGQQQRLCIARAIAAEPEVLLMDEPTSAIDPVATLKIEDLVLRLRERFTIVIVTHNMQQAARISDRTAFFFKGRIIEVGPTQQIFTAPKEKKTEEYITGRFG